jgi:adenylosuccinate lyase
MVEGVSPNPVRKPIKIYDMVSPLDYRYNKVVLEKLQPFVSEEAFIKYQARVEAALVKVMAKWGICSEDVAKEIEKACESITAEEVYREEENTKHNVRALVNCIKRKVSDAAKPFVHLTATSNDITDTANAMRYRDLFKQVILPDLLKLEKLLIEKACIYSDLIQIGRTHGRYAEPVTFGFTLAKYVSRLADRIEAINKAVENLRGKFSGAVGAYNALSLIVKDPENFEKEVLAEVGLKPAIHSTQIVEPQFITDLVCSVISCFSVLANLADDFRHLLRSEIEEIEEVGIEERIGSSTMPHKVNPYDFEHVKSMWKAFMPRIVTVFMDEISEHQRDLTNSASGRFLTELFVAFDHSINWLIEAISHIKVNEEKMKEHVEKSKDEIVAEPLYILLAIHGHPNAYEYVRELLRKAKKTGRKMTEIIWEDENLKPYLEKMTEEQKEILKDPEKYVGKAKEKTLSICSYLKATLLL